MQQVLLIGALVVALAIRVLYVIYTSRMPLRKASTHCSTHYIGIRFFLRFYIAAATDSMSLQKARNFEVEISSNQSFFSNFMHIGYRTYARVRLIFAQMFASSILPLKTVGKRENSAKFMQIYRSREVGQSYMTSIWTTLIATAHALWLMIKLRPEVILCNGPGTCIPLCAIAFIFKVFGIRWSSVFNVESIARVKKLSLSGLLLYKLYMADQFFVQWHQLKTKYPRARYVGLM